MSRQPEQRYAEIGDFWLVKVPGSNRFHIAWYDAERQQRRTRSTGTDDLRAAELLLAEHALKHSAPPTKADPADEALAGVLLRFYRGRAEQQAQAEQVRRAFALWMEFWGDATVADLTIQRQDAFVSWLRVEKGCSDSYIDRIMSSGRAALGRAKDLHELREVPSIRNARGIDQKWLCRPDANPKGRQLTLEEIGDLISHIPEESPHLLSFMMVMLTCVCRPDAAVDLTADRIDHRHRLITLNPEGRQQTKKYRPIVKLTETLEHHVGGVTGPVVAFEGRQVKSIRTAWRALRARVWPATEEQLAALPDAAALAAMTPADRKIALRERFLLCGPDGRDVQPYSLRHTMGRELRFRGVPNDQIELTMGHKRPEGHSATTQVYAPYHPSYCSEAALAIDQIMCDIQKYTRRRIVPEHMVAEPGRDVKDEDGMRTRPLQRRSEEV